MMKTGALLNQWTAILLVASWLIAPFEAFSAAENRYEPNWESLDKRPTPKWFHDAKFGIFIHWGVYSVPGWGAPKSYAEWYWNNMHNKKEDNVWWQYHKKQFGENFDYPEFAPQFRAEFFNPKQWAELFRRAGARYVVLTSKHHEGYCLWPSAEANRAWNRPWTSVDIGPKRDLLGDLSTAVRDQGLRMGFYYSLYEWFNPLWLSDRKRYVSEHMIPQFKDVVTRYRPAVIFSDGEWDLPSSDWRSEELLAWLYNESPCRDEVVVNDRWGKETRHKHGGYYTTEYGAGMKDASHAWEENRGMGYSYGYNRAENLEDYKSAGELILVLCDLVSRGGNFLLDIGPTGDGRIPVIMQQRLAEIGDWLRVNGEAIYGTRYAGRDCQWSSGNRPKQGYKEYREDYNLMQQVGRAAKEGRAVKQAFFTRNSNALYAITPGWPGETLVIRDVTASNNTQVTMLGLSGELKYRTRGKNLEIQIPAVDIDHVPCLHAYAFKMTGAELLPESNPALQSP
ncbi:MAG TPA: alpha-L-fucosidase [Candidatus Paceibacterota bacterium]|nr:alpha-L-fucosidase [Verrucomicrobiota bacterium]HRY48335.1 alpha-L-fucosidase [Candidatus Paceibacterota bacterium]HSA02408.1 alpha-L-fucosidase [Candidatus Paceibacterota bacterium]